MKKSLVFVVITVVALVAGYWASMRFHPAPSPVVGAEVSAADGSNTELPDLEGKTQSLKAWPGKLLLVNFWATWCAPCREEIPLLIELQKRYETHGLQVVGVAIDDRDAVAQFGNEMGINYPILIGQEKAMTLMSDYGNRIGSLPFSVLINREGRIAARKLGIYKRPELEGLIRPLLPSDS
ncbi:MAG: redoxin family protein [Acidiferrobacterales bacterium]